MTRLRTLDKLIIAGHIGLGLLVALGGSGAIVLSRQAFKALALGIFTAQAVLLGLVCGLSEARIRSRNAKCKTQNAKCKMAKLGKATGAATPMCCRFAEQDRLAAVMLEL